MRALLDQGLQAIVTQEAGDGALALGLAAAVTGMAAVSSAGRELIQRFDEMRLPAVRLPVLDCLFAYNLAYPRMVSEAHRETALKVGWKGPIETRDDRAVMVDYLLDHLDSPDAQAIVSFFNDTPWVRVSQDGTSAFLYSPEPLFHGTTVRDLANACLTWLRRHDKVNQATRDWGFCYRPKDAHPCDRISYGRSHLVLEGAGRGRAEPDWTPCD